MIISESGQLERTSSLQQHVRRHNILNHVPSCGTLFSEIILKIGPHNCLIILIPFHYALKVKYSSTWHYLLWLRQLHKYLHTWMHTRIYRNVGMCAHGLLCSPCFSDLPKMVLHSLSFKVSAAPVYMKYLLFTERLLSKMIACSLLLSFTFHCIFHANFEHSKTKMLFAQVSVIILQDN